MTAFPCHLTQLMTYENAAEHSHFLCIAMSDSLIMNAYLQSIISFHIWNHSLTYTVNSR